MNVIAKRTKKSWEKSKSTITNIDSIYDYEETKNLLLKDNAYIHLYGRGKNRTLIKNNPKLYKSIYYHTKDLESYFTLYFKNSISKASLKYYFSFSKRIKFIVDYNCNFNLLKCKCGMGLTWNTYCRKCPEYHYTFTNKTHSSSTKLKMRTSTLDYIHNNSGQVVPRYNKKSISIIENFSKNNEFNFLHAENGGEFYIKELGYFLDAYDPINNVVLEIDEIHHYDKNGNLKDKDVIRQKEIESYLGCKFYRLKI